MNNLKERHYIHGDQLEGNPSLFYCSACDVFFFEEHFLNQADKCCNHWNRYDNAIKMLGKSSQKPRNFTRPMNSINIFTRYN
jgi:hypothetical protein